MALARLLFASSFAGALSVLLLRLPLLQKLVTGAVGSRQFWKF
jgi:hypothetical protein